MTEMINTPQTYAQKLYKLKIAHFEHHFYSDVFSTFAALINAVVTVHILCLSAPLSQSKAIMHITSFTSNLNVSSLVDQAQ